VLGGTSAFIRQQRMALLPAVLHPDPGRVAFIGLGTGITAGAALLDPATRSVTAIELSPLVAALSRKDFADLNGGAADDPRLTVLVEDGRLAMQAARGDWDLIVGDLFMPWQVGTGRLYSVEHFRAVREALAEGGEFCQWLPGFQLTPEQFRVIVASFRDAFPTAYLFRDDRSPETPAFALVGFRGGTLDWSVVERRTAVLRQTGRTRDGFVAFPNLVRALYVGVADGTPPSAGVRNTLDNGWIERRAGLDQIGRRWRYLDADTWALYPEYIGDFATAGP
jgi:spermidine synthase